MSSFGDDTRDDVTPTLIFTKPQRLRLDRDLIPRPHLVERLNRGNYLKFTLISAQAGAGKTALMAQWLRACSQPSAWLSLDNHDNDLVIFARYLYAVIRKVFPEACEHTQDLLNAIHAPPARVIAISIVNELNAFYDSPGPLDEDGNWKDGFILALDEYHNIIEPAIHELVSELIAYLPSCMHLILTSRTDPPLPLAGMGARKEMSELRTNDLQLTTKEAGTLLELISGRKLSEEAVKLQEDKTEGWVWAYSWWLFLFVICLTQGTLLKDSKGQTIL